MLFELSEWKAQDPGARSWLA